MVETLFKTVWQSLIKLNVYCPAEYGSDGWWCSVKQKVASSIPGHGTCLGWGFGPPSGHVQEATN